MQTKNSYPIKKSPFYRLSSKSKLAKLLNLELKELLHLAKDQPYHTFEKEVGQKIREIDNPNPKLKKLQRRIKELLSRIETPGWLFSGKKGVSYLDNAKYHQVSPYVLTCDISSFYPNCTNERIFQIFKYTFEMKDDVAWVLTDLMSYKGRIPTGSPSSQIIAFWAYYPTFLRIEKRLKRKDLKISLYVDDITISSSTRFSKAIANEVKEELEKVGHTIKESKTKYYGKGEFKLITGVAVSKDGELKVPNKRRKKLLETKKLGIKDNETSILAQIRSSQIIEGKYSSKIVTKLKKKD